MANNDRETLTASLQESLITLLAFDDVFGKQVMGILEPPAFDQPYRDIAAKVIKYRNDYKRPPGAAHLDDLFDLMIEGSDERRARMMRDVLGHMVELAKNLNGEYLVTRVIEFIRRQSLKDAVLRAADRYQEGGDNVADDVEHILTESMKVRNKAQDPGLSMDDLDRIFSFMDSPAETYKTGIPELDRYKFGLTKKEMLLYMAARKRGKTWWLIHLGKMARMQHANVLHVTLEMSEEKIGQRYLQSFYGVANREDKVAYAEFIKDEFGNLMDIETKHRRPDYNWSDPAVKRQLIQRMGEGGLRLGQGLKVKGFPSGTLTVERYMSYLDYLDSVHHFVPDVVLLDYPDIMALDAKNLRTSTGQTYVRLRGVAQDRNHALGVVTQGNREATNARVVDESNASEDISKFATADMACTYSQTPAEKALGLARLMVSNARNDKDRYTTLISQSYDTGQYCLASAPVNSQYQDVLQRLSGVRPEDDGDGE